MATEWTTNTTAEEMAAWLRTRRRILLLTHQKSDGDAAGSMAALGRALIDAGVPEVTGLIAGPAPGWFDRVMDGVRVLHTETGGIQTLADEGIEPDGIVVQDTGSRSQLEPFMGLLEGRAEIAAIIDHHLSGDGDLASRRLIETSAAAVCEVSARVACALLSRDDPSGLPGDVAQPLYLGLATDTGWFRHSNVTPAVHRLAASLLEAGADGAALYALVAQTERPSRLRLMARVLDSLEMHADGRIAVLCATSEDFSAARAGPGETGGMVDLGLTVEGVSVSVLLTEVTHESAEPLTKVSLRSASAPASGPPVDVNVVAGTVGGGGHARAAGARLRAPIDQAKARILEALEPAVGAAKGSPSGSAP